MPKSRYLSFYFAGGSCRLREKKPGGEQQANAPKKEKKISNRSTSKDKGIHLSFLGSNTDSESMTSRSKRNRRRELTDPSLDDPNPDLMDLDEDLEDLEDQFDAPPGEQMEDDYHSNDSHAHEEEPPAPSMSASIIRNISTMRGLHGMMNNVHGTLKSILPNLRNHHDPTMQHVALQELAELLAISTEETLAGYLAPEPYVVELIKILKGGEENSPFGDNPDIMLLASRCLANLMEALPQSTGTVVYSGAVPVLCSKLLEIQYIDLAEQALSVYPYLISTDY